MKRIVMIISLMLALLVTGVACSNNSTALSNNGSALIGKWKAVDTPANSDAMGTIEFLKDGTAIVGYSYWPGDALMYQSTSYRVLDSTRLELDGSLVLNYAVSHGQLVVEMMGEKMRLARTK